MRTPALDPALEAQARQALGGDGVPVEVINDSPGFVSQRVVASIVNLGCEIAQKGIADPHTLDRAITLALGYPKGPLGFAEHYGAARCLSRRPIGRGDPRPAMLTGGRRGAFSLARSGR